MNAPFVAYCGCAPGYSGVYAPLIPVSPAPLAPTLPWYPPYVVWSDVTVTGTSGTICGLAIS